MRHIFVSCFLLISFSQYAQTILTQNWGQNFTNQGVYSPNADNSYYREFVINEEGISGEYEITGFRIAAQNIIGDFQQTFTAEVRLLTEQFPTNYPASSTALLSEDFEIGVVGTFTTFNFSSSVTVTATDRILLIITDPNNGVDFSLNTSALEQRQSYYSSVAENIPISSLDQLGAPDAHFMMDLVGNPINATDVPQSEKDALMEIYNATNGDDWSNNTNWGTDAPVSTWNYIFTENNSILRIFPFQNNITGSLPDVFDQFPNLETFNFSENPNLGGSIPQTIYGQSGLLTVSLNDTNISGSINPSIGNLTQLTTLSLHNSSLFGEIPPEIGNLQNLAFLRLQDAQFSGILPSSLSNLLSLNSIKLQNNSFSGAFPDFTSLSSLTELKIENNNFQLGDLETNYNTYLNTIQFFTASPQAKLTEDSSQIVSIGETVTLQVPAVNGSQNSYQWYKETVPINGANDLEFTFTVNSEADYANYHLEATSPLLTDFILESGTFNISRAPQDHPDYNALVSFYNSTQGNNWFNNDGWLDANTPIADWFGITEENGRVVVLLSRENNLYPSLPNNLVELTSLRALVLTEGATIPQGQGGNIPFNIGELPNLDTFSINNVSFTGTIPVSLATNTNVRDITINFTELEGPIPMEFSNSTNLDFLFFFHNNLSGEVPNIPITTSFGISVNDFQFGDLEPSYANNSQSQFYIYNDQNPLPYIGNLIVELGSTYTVQSNVSGTQNNYFWKKRNSDGSSTVVSNDQNFTITINDTSDFGAYFLEVTSDIVPNLTLFSEDFAIGADPTLHPDYPALIALYNATDGANWTDPWDITAPISSWDSNQGAIVLDETTNRVTRLFLNNRNLTGTIPPEINGLVELEELWFFINNLSGEVPSELWDLTNLRYLLLGAQENNALTLPNNIVPPEISNMQDLFWLNVTGIPQTDLPEYVFDLPNLGNFRGEFCGYNGPLPSFLDQVDNVRLNGNSFFGEIPQSIIDNALDDNLSSKQLAIADNLFVFSDLEPLVNANNYQVIEYSPQRTLNIPETINGFVGEDITLTIDISDGGPTLAAESNLYQWQKDGESIDNATGEVYIIENAQISDSGSYTCIITNILLPDLTIERAASVISFEVDTENPMAQAQNLTIELDENGSAAITADQVNDGSTDNSNSELILEIDLSTFSCDDIGENVVILTVTDQSGNSSTSEATITVLDNLVPTVIVQNINLVLDNNGTATITTAQVDNGSTDNCEITSIELDQSDFNCDNVGENTVMLLVTDSSGNTVQAEATVTVVDDSAPTAVAQNLTMSLDVNGQLTVTPVMIDNMSSDNCGVDSLSLDITSFDCDDLGDNTVTLTVADASGNTSTATAMVTVVDDLAPDVLGQDITVDLEGNDSSTITPDMLDNGTTDNCDFTLSIDQDTFTEVGQYDVILLAIDGSGNSSDVTVIVTVDDSLSVDTNFETFEVVIYPNPTHEFLFIESSVQINTSSVYDVSGQLILKESFSNKIDVRNLSTGVYFITLASPLGNTSRRFVKE